MPRKLRTLDDIPLDGKRVIVRVDFNVTTSEDGVVSADESFRISAALPTIEELLQKRCKVLLLGHRGRPWEGGPSVDYDMTPIVNRLSDLLREDVRVLPKLFGSQVETIVGSMESGTVAMFPNVRVDERERSASESFGKDLAESADAYVNEAFSASHRDHTSVSVLPTLLDSVAGRRTVLEVETLENLQDGVEHPYVAVIGGAKIETKFGMLENLLDKVDTLCVGGAVANVFIAAQGHWSVDAFGEEEIEGAKKLIEKAGDKLLLPVDVVVGKKDGTSSEVVAVEDIDASVDGLFDIGPVSASNIVDACSKSKTVMWNGPVGMWEVKEYGGATEKIAMSLAEFDVRVVIGGGDTVNAIESYGVAKKFDHVSVGGGAMIAFLEGATMPGLEPLYE